MIKAIHEKMKKNLPTNPYFVAGFVGSMFAIGILLGHFFPPKNEVAAVINTISTLLLTIWMAYYGWSITPKEEEHDVSVWEVDDKFNRRSK